MSQLYKISNSIIKPATNKYPVWIIQAADPEIILVKLLREFFVELDFSGMYTNFGNLRVDRIHPFALLLFQDIMSQKFDFSVFPSVTVCDTVENENFTTLGREYERIVLDNESVTELSGHLSEGRIIASTTSFNRLLSATDSGKVLAEKAEYTGDHRIDLNIWSDNKDITSSIYDMLILFFNVCRSELHNCGLDVIGTLDGRRSGDINVEFGMLLFGANLTVPCVIKTSALKVDVNNIQLISSVDTQTNVYPNYQIRGS